MEGAQTFRELRAWQLCEELKEKVVEILKRPEVSRDFKWCDQIGESVRSAPALIAEGFGRFGPKENAKYVLWAKAEVNETRNHLRDGLKSGHMTVEEYRKMYRLTRQTLRVCGRYHAYLRSPRAQQNANRLLKKQQERAVRNPPRTSPPRIENR